MEEAFAPMGRRFLLQRSVLALLAVVGASPALATRELHGTTPGGASYAIVAPDNWQPGGTLVIYNHGYGFEIEHSPSLGPLKDQLLAQGYAIAASGYRQRGWALFTAMDDNAELLAQFSHDVGAPGRLLAVGGSMGGLISLKMLDDSRFSALAGVYAVCAPADPVAAWDSALDLRLAYDATCSGVTGGSLPRGRQPLPWALDPGDIPENLSGFEDNVRLLQAAVPITVCTGLGIRPSLRSDGQQRRLAQLMDYSGIDNESFLTTNLGYAVFGLSDLVRSADKLGNRNAFDSRYVGSISGSTAAFDLKLGRYAPDLFARFDFGRSSIPARIQNNVDGGRNTVPVVSLYTSGDLLVRPFNADSIHGARTVLARVDEEAPSHCGFTDAEAIGGFDTLVRLASGTAAAADSRGQAQQVLDACQRAMAQGVAGPCRIDPASAGSHDDYRPRMRISDLSDRYGSGSPVDGNTSGQWYTEARSGEGQFLEILPDNKALVAWFTYPPAGADGEQRWLFGSGDWIGNGVRFDSLYETRGARFGSGFDPGAVVRTAWGPATFVFDGADPATSAHGRLRFAGPAAYGSDERPLTQLTHLAAITGIDFSVPPPSNAAIAYSGTFWNPLRSGEGVFVTQQSVVQGDPPDAVPRIFIAWFTYDTAGRQMWLYGEASGRDGHYQIPLLRPVGTRFGADFDPQAVQRASFGSATLDFSDCNHASLGYAATQAGFGSGQIRLERFSRPIGTGGCTP